MLSGDVHQDSRTVPRVFVISFLHSPEVGDKCVRGNLGAHGPVTCLSCAHPSPGRKCPAASLSTHFQVQALRGFQDQPDGAGSLTKGETEVTLCADGGFRVLALFNHRASWGSPGVSDYKESACNSGNLGLNTGSGRSPAEGNGYPLQYSYLENSVDREA